MTKGLGIIGGKVLKGSTLIANRGVWCDARWQGLNLGAEKFSEMNGKNLFQTVWQLPSNWTLAPGFVDIHIHGMAGRDVMDGEEEGLQVISEALVKTGVTSWLGTTMTMETPKIQKALRAADHFRGLQRWALERETPTGAKLEGIHLEGPYISKAYKGAQDPAHILPLDEKQFERDFYQMAPTLIKHLTLAPENEGSEVFIKALREKAISVALGHTGCTYEEAINAKAAGAGHITHFFNAMAQTHHREPGLVGAGLMTDFSIEWIADRIHLRPEWFGFLLNLKKEKAILVTDAMCAAGLCPGHYTLGGQAVVTDGSSARLENGVLAGSVLTMIQAVKNMAEVLPNQLGEILHAASTAPAQLVGLEGIGAIEDNYAADFLLLDEALEIRAVCIHGQLVFSQQLDLVNV